MESNAFVKRNLIEDNKTYKYVSEILRQKFPEVTGGFSERNMRCDCVGATFFPWRDFFFSGATLFFRRDFFSLARLCRPLPDLLWALSTRCRIS